MWRGLLARILTLLQTLLVHLVVKQIRDRRQLIKVGAVTQSYVWALLWALWTLSRLSGPGMKAQSQGYLSQTEETLHRISRTSLLLCWHGVCYNAGTPGNIIGPG